MKISISYMITPMSDVLTIIEMLRPETFEAKLYLPNEGIMGTLEMYSNKKTFSYRKMANGIKAEKFSFDITEV